MKAAFYTLGCKVNQNETGALEHIFEQAGYEIVPHNSTADVYIVNSCTVTAGGDAKSRQWLRRARRENPGAVTVLTGCFPQAFPKEALIPEADVITGTANRAHLLQDVQQFMASQTQVINIVPHKKGEAFEELPIENMPGRTRIFVKIQDGCNRQCAYCIIPTARGPVRSRSEDAILAELHTLAGAGYSEVVFTGINLPSYGKDTATNLAEITQKSALVPGIQRIRLSSLDPDLITDAQIETFAATPQLCPSFHLSLQSGSNDTLRRMRRPYTAEKYREVAKKLLAALPGASLTTDVIVGFPGETEEEFAQSLAFVKEMRFLKVHVFPYSTRPGTPAAQFENQIPKQEKSRRAALLQQEADAIRAEWIQEQHGTLHQVLLEKPVESGLFTGYTGNYIPVRLHAPSHKQGDIVSARLQEYCAKDDYCVAEMI